jgi:hypothetical protein
MRRSPELQCESGQPALGSSRPRLRTPASAGHPAQSSSGRDTAAVCRVRVNVATSGLRLRGRLQRPDLGCESLRVFGWLIAKRHARPWSPRAGSSTTSAGGIVRRGCTGPPTTRRPPQTARSQRKATERLSQLGSPTGAGGQLRLAGAGCGGWEHDELPGRFRRLRAAPLLARRRTAAADRRG